jgi:ubiquinone biosynthesis protein
MNLAMAASPAAIRAALGGPAGRRLREEMGSWVIGFLPAERVVPDVYAAWRPLVRDAMLFMIRHLSAGRLAPKLAEQMELPADTTPEARLLRLIAKVPALQKIGQVLARNRHFHPALRHALSELENGISDVTPGEIRAVLEQQLGPQIERYDVEIEPDIFSEASVSAVMRFTWLNPESGERERGVFKVMKPYVPACFAEDLALLQQLASHLAAIHPEYGGALPETINETRRLLEHEVDFPREQITLTEAARAYRHVRGVRVPRLIRPLSTATITAMSEEEGVKVTVLAGAEASERRRAAQQVIQALVAVPLLASGRTAIFHADPHAGNMLYNECTGELVLLDWALTERLTIEQRRRTAVMAVLLGLRDPVGVAAEIEALTLEGAALDPEQRRFIRGEVDRFIGQLPFSRLPGSVEAMRLLDRLALHGVRFPSGLMMFRKVLFTLDGILHDLAAPNVHVDWVIARELAGRWLGNLTSFGSPLSVFDWIGVQSSALLYGARLWVQWAQAALDRGTWSAADH